jgi:hypothetical protein
MLCIEDIVEHILAPPFFTDFRIDMTDLQILTRWLLEECIFNQSPIILCLHSPKNKLKGELFHWKPKSI